MMDNLRAAANHVVLKIILGLIAFSFVLTGVGNYLIGGDGDYAAKVNGQQISRSQLEQAVQNERNRQQEAMGEQFSQLAANEGYMRQQVLSQLIDETLLDQYADKLGLAISDDQIKQAIFAILAFRTEDKFDNAKFRSLIGNMGLSPDQYATLMRKQLLTQQLIQGIGGTGFLLPAETDRLLEVAVQTREARLAMFAIAALAAKQTASDDEIQASYNAYKNQYLSPEAFKVSYIPMDAETMQTKTTVDEQEIQAWYDQHHDQFTVPGRKRYSIIQSKSENDANDWLKQLQQGADFASLAKAHSTDVVSAKNGGDIGWMSDSDTLDELKQANLSQKGQLSGVIKSSVGFLIIRLDDMQPAQVSPLSAVHDEVAAKVKQEKAIDAYYALQQKVSDAASNDNETLASAETAAGIKAQQTDWFSHDDVPAALNYDAVKQVLFQGSLLGSNSDVITVDGNRSFVIRIAEHRPERVQPLEDVRARVEQEVKRQKALEQARVDAEKALVALKQDKGTEALQAAGLSFSAPQQFDSANQGDPLAQTVFTLPQPPHGKSSYGMASNAQGDIVLIALDSVTPRTLEEQQRKQFVDQLNQGMTGVAFDALLENLRAEAKIKMGAAAQMQ
ncbi:Peptidyl-prolyl cis-trans isomerase D [Sodalis glossinidius str. 'morsitans']|uniref:Periplasmic chaperone PpiD n=1 Tax=Sodalis glossinidius (strain morsitans) TaxID=343509 RepID=Q2NV75_SODGM|nr:peptidylprolyl isomerase [Sodalis glossinidius]BAE73950.1 peptidyl-prolyl cis-trans isomerase D [Sodalis glossinidius str. 'morsitans']CRL44418.1 Peptidyl-prolyl cis-trans isomerase D [Sodalis glossinidius str. 'morsitans']